MIGTPTARTFLPLAALAIVGVAAACGNITVETSSPPDGREIAPVGVIRGTVSYSGRRPCSSGGHIVGAAVLFVFDRHNPPPPNGLATTPLNFAVVSGDALFANEPRSPGSSVYCPADSGVTGTITASAPFTVAPLVGGQYVIQSFYDYTGDFLPTFKFRNLPELGDVGGGVIDSIDALKTINANPNYQPHFLPVDVGVATPGATDASGIPAFTIPGTGFVTDNVTVNLGAVLTTTRPYFYPGGLSVSFDANAGTLKTTRAQTSASAASTDRTGVNGTVETDPNYVPILTIPQDFPGLLAAPSDATNEASVNNFESKLPHLVLDFAVPAAERATALAPPLHFQLGGLAPAADAGAGDGGAAPPANGFAVWQNQTFDPVTQSWVPQDIAEAPGIPQLWPLVVLQKLDFDATKDPQHTLDPASLNAQGSATAPVVILQGITLLVGNKGDVTDRDSLFLTGSAEQSFDALIDRKTRLPKVFVQDHLTVILKPAAICFNSLFDSSNPDKRGTLVVPTLLAPSADVAASTGNVPIIPTSALTSAQLAPLVGGDPVQACLPTGRYAINVIYPDGQAWTVPNEAGACVAAEGAADYASDKPKCTVQPRPVIRSQGTRAVVEIVKATDPSHCVGALAVPAACLPAPAH